MILNLEGMLNDMAEKKSKKYDEKNDFHERAYSQTQELIEIKKMKHQELVEIKKMDVEELIRVKREKLQLERMTKELKITMMDATNLDPEQQQCISQLCQEIIQHQEKSNWGILLHTSHATFLLIQGFCCYFVSKLFRFCCRGACAPFGPSRFL